MTTLRPRAWALALAAGLLLALAPAAAAAPAAQKGSKADLPQPVQRLLFKTTADAKGNKVELHLDVFLPEGHKATDKRPAIVFFFGGGWVGGSPSQFYSQAAYLASRGMVALAAEYRVGKTHGTTPKECVADGKSAIRYVRSHAAELGIDPDRLAAGGGSAGGHVAAATATVTAFDEPGEDTATSAVPNALVLFNPVYDNGPEGYGYDRVKDYWRQISPLQNIRKGMPPAIVWLGTQDKLIPVATAKAFQAEMQRLGSRSDLLLYEGEGHGFFNSGRGSSENYAKTVREMDAFLTSLGWLKAQPAPAAGGEGGEKDAGQGG